MKNIQIIKAERTPQQQSCTIRIVEAELRLNESPRIHLGIIIPTCIAKKIWRQGLCEPPSEKGLQS
jgi:hypothetical protein